MAKQQPRRQALGTGAVIAYGALASTVSRALEGVPEDQIMTITLNGEEVQAAQGETIMEVCHRNDTYVPHYCWHPALSIAGNCRLCLVEVEKVPKPVIACQTTVSPGMVVRTKSEAAKSAQEWMMEFLLVNHPLDCPICDRGGECQLQRYSMEYGTPHTRMADKKRKFIKPQADPLIDIERNRCIMCTRCVRFCDEVAGEHVMGVFARGNDNYIGTFGQGPVSNIFSGNVIDLCPVGCLTSKPYRFKARPWELKQTQTTCDGCSAGCKVTAWTRNGKLYRTTPPSRKRHDHFTINEDTEEFICNQGRFGSDYGASAKRADQSMIRRAGRMAPTSFEGAARAAAEQLKAVADAHGPESIAFLVGPRATLEEGFLAARLAKQVVGTQSIDWRASFADTAAADAVSKALDWADGDLEQVPDAVIVVNGALAAQSPVLALRIQEFGRRLGTRIIMVGHHHDAYIAGHASDSFHNAPGATAGILDTLAAAIKEQGSDGPAAKALRDAWNLDAEQFEDLRAALAGAARGLVVHGLEDFAGRYGSEEVPAAAALAEALGGAWGYLPVVRDRNAVGLHAVGTEPGEGGVAAPDLLRAIHEGRIKGLFAFGMEPLHELRGGASLEAAFKKLEAFVVADHFDGAHMDHAGAFLALATNTERDGVYADIEGNLALLREAERPLGDARSGVAILTAVGRALGAAGFGADDAESAWALVRAAMAPESTVRLSQLELEGSTNPAHYVDIRPQGGARNRAVEYNPGNYRTDGLHLRGSRPAIEPGKARSSGEVALPAGEGRFVLAWGSHISAHGWIQDHAAIADILLPKPFVEMHPSDAAELGVEDDQFVVLHLEGAKAKAAVRVCDGPAPGVLYLPAKVYGPFDASLNAGPAPVRVEVLQQSAPSQTESLSAPAS